MIILNWLYDLPPLFVAREHEASIRFTGLVPQWVVELIDKYYYYA